MLEFRIAIRANLDVPGSVDEHLVAGLTLNTAWGEQWIIKTSSGVKASDGCRRTSSSIDFDITSLVGAPASTASAGSAMWKENGTGSSSYESSKLMYQPSGDRHTRGFSLFSKASRPSLETFAGIFTAGAKAVPSSSETNWTTMFGQGAGSSGTGSAIPWYTFCRFGGGNSTDIVDLIELKNYIWS